jgi:hypothetical protein
MERGGMEGDWGYAGRGPKGYRRSDERIEEEVNDRLTRHPGIDASEIEVSVSNGEVTLRGTVSNRQQKRAAEDCVEEVFGVENVQNQLRVAAGRGRGQEQEWEREREASTDGGRESPAPARTPSSSSQRSAQTRSGASGTGVSGGSSAGASAGASAASAGSQEKGRSGSATT